MRLWTIQPATLYELLITKKVIHGDPSKSEYINKYGFVSAYEWMSEQMKLRISNPPDGVKYPIWAWHTLNWKHQRPDLRRIEFRNYDEDQVCIELEIPDNEVLLSDEEMWHIVLNGGYCSDSTNETEEDAEYKWLENLSKDEQEHVIKKSWEKIFKISPPLDTEWNRRGMFIQATFWELRYEQVTDVRHFKGKRQIKNTY